MTRPFLLGSIFLALAACGGKDGKSSLHGDCDQYLECIEAVIPSTADQAEMAYGSGSACWTSSLEVQKGCRDACTAGLMGIAATYPDEIGRAHV